MNDLISRQVVIGLIRGMYPSPPIFPPNRRKWEEKYEPFIRVEKEVRNLPPVQPSEEYERGWKYGREALREETWGGESDDQ